MRGHGRWRILWAAGIAPLCLAGCADKPIAVSVNLDKIPVSAVSSTLAGDRLDVESPGPIGGEAAVPQGPPVSSGNTGAAIAKATRELQIAHEKALRSTLRRLQREYLARAAADDAARIEALQPEIAVLTRSTYDRLRGAFEEHANQVGWKRMELANMVGHPDPGGDRPRLYRPWFPAKEGVVQAKRREIEALEKQFERTQGEAFLDLDRQIDAKLAAARVQLATAEDQALIQAEKDAKERFASMVRAGISLGATAIEHGATAAQRVALQSQPLRRSAVPAPRTQTVSTQDAARALNQTLAQIWADQHGFILAKGAPDRTQEFLAWKRSIERGR